MKKLDFLSDEFLRKYEGVESPLSPLGEFVYLRTYSRYLPEKGRRENWLETCKRVVNYNVGLGYKFAEKEGLKINHEEFVKEAEFFFDNIFNLRTFCSGRTLWVGGTPNAEMFPLANYNCSFIQIETLKDYSEMFYMLMLGSGVGFRILPEDVEKLPTFRSNVYVAHDEYKPIPKGKRLNNTSLEISNLGQATITVGDSREGWVTALETYFELLTSHLYKDVTFILFNYDNVRPEGERLVRFGGQASGYKSMMNMIQKIHDIIYDKEHKTTTKKLKPIDALDIGNIIAENVVSGGVRRSSQIALFSGEDTEVLNAKNDIYTVDSEGNWSTNEDLLHRRMSNNSVLAFEKPSRETLHNYFTTIRYSGEPGFINAKNASSRRENFKGLNPCAEILLDSKQCCNLTTNNLLSYVDDKGVLDTIALIKGLKLSTRIGIRMTLVDLEMEEWNKKQKRDRLIGVSLTGYQDMVGATNMSVLEQKILLRAMRQAVKAEAERYAKELGINTPLLATTVKPEGTISLLPGVSPGVHFPHAKTYIRRVRISAFDPLCKLVESLNYPVFPEVGQDEVSCKTKVIEFPAKSPTRRTKFDVSAIEQLEIYKMFMENWTDHNTSITISVRDNEWEDVEQWVWDNWDSIVGVSFLSLDDNYYPLLPYEETSYEDYVNRVAQMRQFSAEDLALFEEKETDLDIGNEGCEGGVCPIR